MLELVRFRALYALILDGQPSSMIPSLSSSRPLPVPALPHWVPLSAMPTGWRFALVTDVRFPLAS